MLEIDPKLLLITVVVFLALIYALNTILFKPILSFVDERNEGIASEEKEAAKYGSDIKKYEEEAASILAAARDEAIALKSSITKKANDIAKEQIDAKKAQIEKDYKDFEDSLAAEHAELKAALQTNLPDIKASLKSTLSRL